MLFRNARIYIFDDQTPPTADALRAALAASEFQPCATMQEESTGFTTVRQGQAAPTAAPADAPPAELLLEINDAVLLRHRLQQKILPASAINEMLDERLQNFESRTGRSAGTRERRDLKDELRGELMPRALTRSTMTWVLLDRSAGWLAVDTPQGSRAERVLDSLREALGNLRVVPLAFHDSSSKFLARLLLGENHPPFALGEICRLTDPLHDVTDVRYRNADLTDTHLRGQVRTGLKPTAVELNWKDQLAFVLDTEPCLQRIRDLASPDDDSGNAADNPAESLEGDLALCHLTLRAILGDLDTALGGRARAATDNPGDDS